MSSYTISCVDEEILKALTIANDIRKEVFFHSTSDNRYNIPFESGNSEIVISVSDSTSDSVFLKSSDPENEFESFKFDSEFQVVSENIQELYMMNDLFLKRKRTLEAKTKSFIEDAMSDSQEIISESILGQRLKSINLVLKHVETIADKMNKIKQILQDEPLKSSIKVSPSCQKDVIQFFQTVKSIITIEDSENVLEYTNNKTKVIPMNEKALHSKLQSIIAGLARRIDILTEFRSHLSTEDVESGIELGISELCKSDNPKLLTDQISSLDSGCNSLLKFN